MGLNRVWEYPLYFCCVFLCYSHWAHTQLILHAKDWGKLMESWRDHEGHFTLNFDNNAFCNIFCSQRTCGIQIYFATSHNIAMVRGFMCQEFQLVNFIDLSSVWIEMLWNLRNCNNADKPGLKTWILWKGSVPF